MLEAREHCCNELGRSAWFQFNSRKVFVSRVFAVNSEFEWPKAEETVSRWRLKLLRNGWFMLFFQVFSWLLRFIGHPLVSHNRSLWTCPSTHSWALTWTGPMASRCTCGICKVRAPWKNGIASGWDKGMKGLAGFSGLDLDITGVCSLTQGYVVFFNPNMDVQTIQFWNWNMQYHI